MCLKRVFPVENGKVALVRAPMFVTYYIKLFRTESDRQEGLLMSPLLLAAETNIFIYSQFIYNLLHSSPAHILHCDNKKLIENYKCNFFR